MRYVLVWISLVVLATLSLILSRTVGGSAGLVLSLGIAALKAGIVAAFFMHLWGGRGSHRLAFITAIAFVIVLVLGVVADVGLRSSASSYVDVQGTSP
jgi:cytochrome c oxidase subunit 4